MSTGLYSTEEKVYDKKLDFHNIKPYGDTMNDGKIQMSFTLPVPCNEKGMEAALVVARKLGLKDPAVAHTHSLDKEFSFYVVYGVMPVGIDYENIKVQAIEIDTMDMHETEDFIEENIKKPVVIVGASTGTDAHTVGIDAIMNMKGYAGHYGLERYKGIEAYNLGSQVPNEEFIRKAVELNADALLISQTVTQKDVHIQNLTNLIELIEAEGLREKMIIIAGGPRITNELAKELGYDAGFGPGKYADDVATFIVKEIVKRKEN
ncbi:MAG: OAM dimerization domain-containing protein [Fusobacteriaceae bacterium]